MFRSVNSDVSFLLAEQGQIKRLVLSQEAEMVGVRYKESYLISYPEPIMLWPNFEAGKFEIH